MKAFPPDSRLVHHVRPSPNHDERACGVATDILLLHYTGMSSTAAALDRLCDPVARVSSHYVVDESGQITQLVPEARRAWHAGVSSWEGETDNNSRSIGIEIDNVGAYPVNGPSPLDAWYRPGAGGAVTIMVPDPPDRDEGPLDPDQ